MKPHEQTLHVEGCGNPKHGPFASCWKVVDVRGGCVIQGVPKDIADLYAAAPDMVRALLAVLEHDRACREHPETAHRNPVGLVSAALVKAGVIPAPSSDT